MEKEDSVIHVDKANANKRLDMVLVDNFPSLSRAKIQKSIAEGTVLLNGMLKDKNTQVKDGDRILLKNSTFCNTLPSELVPEDISLSIIYEDESIIAVNKPAGMVVHPGNGNLHGTLVHALLHHSQLLSAGSEPDRPGIVHRLDKDTSGLILIAKNDTVHSTLATAFANRTIKKEYIGICVGTRPKEHADIHAALGRSTRDPIKRTIREDGKPAHTEYWLLAYQCGISVLRFSPHTGRTHQIRVHANANNFPVLCDTLYNGRKEAVDRLEVLDRPFAYSVYKCFARHALHAHKVTFSHPVTNKEMVLTAPLPDDFKKALGLFGREQVTGITAAGVLG
jgi:23S rRNA pseudouridine1911/1915/1917 synthase